MTLKIDKIVMRALRLYISHSGRSAGLTSHARKKSYRVAVRRGWDFSSCC
jgi:hypothetical protein